MKTNKEILKTSKEVEEIVAVMEKINKEAIDFDRKGYTSVRIGNAYVSLKENKNENHEYYPTVGYGDIFLHIGDKNGAIYISSGITQSNLRFKDDFGRIQHGRYFEAEEILSIRLFSDAYEKVINKLIAVKQYYNNIEKENQKQIALLQSI